MSATLEAGAATSAEIEVSYHVRGASWRPLYDLTLEGERLAVSYLAEVWQQSGEDWPAVELILSTTRRGLHQALPELDPWYIGRARPVPAPYPAMAMRKGLSAPRTAGGPTDDNEMAVASAAAAPLAPHLTAEPAQSGEPGDLGRAWPTGCSARWPCPPTVSRTRPWWPSSRSTPNSTTSRFRFSPPRRTRGPP